MAENQILVRVSGVFLIILAFISGRAGLKTPSTSAPLWKIGYYFLALLFGTSGVSSLLSPEGMKNLGYTLLGDAFPGSKDSPGYPLLEDTSVMTTQNKQGAEPYSGAMFGDYSKTGEFDTVGPQTPLAPAGASVAGTAAIL
jgi:hypothetical protein